VAVSGPAGAIPRERPRGQGRTGPSEGGRVVGDRWLGEEWVDWAGEDEGRVTEAGKGTFLTCAAVGFAASAAAAWLLLYLMEPRLAGLSRPAYAAFETSFWAAVSLGAGWFVSIVLSALYERRIGLALLRYNRSLSVLYSLASFAARRLGVSRDRFGGSFIKVSNALIRARGRSGPIRRILILAPRCLARNLKESVRDMAARYGCEIYTAAGGESARRKIAESKPDAVVGIACERDLVSGIRDVYPLMPVLAVPNVRPNGPCKDTRVDLAEVEEAVRFFARNPG